MVETSRPNRPHRSGGAFGGLAESRLRQFHRKMQFRSRCLLDDEAVFFGDNEIMKRSISGFFWNLTLAALLPTMEVYGGEANIAAAKKVKDRVGQFLRMADKVAMSEIELPRSEKFSEVQAWTLRYQKYPNSREAGDFRRLFVLPPKVVKLAQLQSAFVKYGKESTELAQNLIGNVNQHISMFTLEEKRKDYIGKYRRVLDTMFPNADSSLQEFSVFDCDYTSQPTNAFWYTMQATRFIDEYGESLYGEEWKKARDQLVDKHHIMSMKEMRSAVSKDALLDEPIKQDQVQSRSTQSAPAGHLK